MAKEFVHGVPSPGNVFVAKGSRSQISQDFCEFQIPDDRFDDSNDGSKLHVALLDHRTCGGEDQMLTLAEAYAGRCSEFFYLFLAFRPITKGRRTDNNSEQQRTSRLTMVIRRFGNLCTVGFLDADLITLSRSHCGGGPLVGGSRQLCKGWEKVKRVRKQLRPHDGHMKNT